MKEQKTYNRSALLFIIPILLASAFFGSFMVCYIFNLFFATFVSERNYGVYEVLAHAGGLSFWMVYIGLFFAAGPLIFIAYPYCVILHIKGKTSMLKTVGGLSGIGFVAVFLFWIGYESINFTLFLAAFFVPSAVMTGFIYWVLMNKVFYREFKTI